MKAIKITQQLKDLNPKIGTVGTIKEGKLPKSFFSLNYNRGQRTDGYHVLDNSIHELDGFYDIVTPTITEYQRLVNLHFDTDHFTYDIEDFTQEEIDAHDQQKEDNEADSKYQEHLEKGLNFHRRSYKKVWKRVLKDRDTNNKLSKSKGRKLFRWFEPVWNNLKNGDFREAEKSVVKILVDNDTLLQTEPAMLNTIEWFVDLIHGYYDPSLNNGDNEYDL